MKKTGISFFTFITLLIGCSDFELFEGEAIRQYAGSVIDFSSQYTSGDWSAAQALGEQDVFPIYADNENAWSPATEDTNRDYLILGFNTPQTVKKIEVYETWYPGAIDTVYLRDSKSEKWIIVYSKSAKTDLPEEARIFTIHLIETPYFADAIRLAVNNPAVGGWNEIDAVAITGQK